MKIIKINDNLKINIEQIYSLERTSNINDINNWEEKYNHYLNVYAKDPILLPIDETRTFKPKYGEMNNEEDLKLYMDALHNHILGIIGSKPTYIEKFYILLITGLKINVDETIYNKVDKYLEKFIVE